MELVRARHCPEARLGLKEERFRLRKGPKGFAVITVDGEAVETLVANAVLQAAEQGSGRKAAEPQQAHPKGGAKKRPAAARKRPAAADEEEDEGEAKGARARDDSEDDERESSQETDESDLEGAAGGSSKRKPAAADRQPAAAEDSVSGKGERGGGGLCRGPSLEVEEDSVGGKAWIVMWYKAGEKKKAAAAIRQVHKPCRQVCQWTAGDHSEEQMREMAADMVSKLCLGEITEATVEVQGEEYLRNKFSLAAAA